jgi:exonuclease SbcC
MFFLKRKPAWESLKSHEREAAVATALDPALLERLADFARNDTDAKVREAAIRRLNDLSLLGDRARHDSDAKVRKSAEERYRMLLISETIPKTERERVIRIEENMDILIYVATHSTESAIRQETLERITRTSILIERCQNDPDPAIRLALLQRINDITALERIAESTRKSDKHISHAARARIEDLKLAVGDHQILQKHAMALGEAADILRRERPSDIENQYALLNQKWRELSALVSDDLRKRIDGHLLILELSLKPFVQEVEVKPEPKTHNNPTEITETAVSIKPSLAQKESDSVAAEHKKTILIQAKAAQTLILSLLPNLEKNLEDGRLQDAHNQDQKIREHIASSKMILPSQLAERISDAQTKLQKLIRWQRWSHHKIRKDLCTQIEILLTQGLHPDAVANRIRELQLQWSKLDSLETLSDTKERSEPSSLARRFRSLCHQALAPTKPYFEKRQALRDERKNVLEAFLQKTENLELPILPAAQSKLRSELMTWLRRLNDMDPRSRGELSQRIKALLANLDKVRNQQWASADTEKRKLISNLRRALTHAVLEDAVRHCQEATNLWKTLPKTSRELELGLAQEFDSLINPWIEKEKIVREQQEQEQIQKNAELDAVIQELQALPQSDYESLRQIEQRISSLTERWRTLTSSGHDSHNSLNQEAATRKKPDQKNSRQNREKLVPNQRERAFEQAVKKAKEAQKAALFQFEQNQEAQLENAAKLCAELESLTLSKLNLDQSSTTNISDLQTDWHNLTLPAHIKAEMESRFNRAKSWLDRLPTTLEIQDLIDSALLEAQKMAVRAECLLGIESPTEWQEQRKIHQVERLAQRFSNRSSKDAETEYRELKLAWFLLGPIPSKERLELHLRIMGKN